ncbi:MAG TPA: thiamine pyrophosphate-dependent enzyme [Candidatus Paceibacterota bacterium]|nr:thiamine pyrophosphate-dependent enzyme [Candidatus Paceibacterota bacterium]
MTFTKEQLKTNVEITWCPGCPNFLILESVKRTIAKLISESEGKIKKEDFAIVTGIGCHAKIFDYLDLSGIYGLHGRVLPLATGIKLGNRKLNVLGFSGDGDAYAEGMEHFIHSCRYNSDMTYIVHDNRAFSLTTGQATPTSQQGYKTKAEPFGEMHEPINPVKLALVSGATFVARCNAKDIEHTAEIIEKAIKHKGFAFIEIIQNCLIFNVEDNIDKVMYKLPDNKNDMEKAMKLASEWNYNSHTSNDKVPIGIFYQVNKPTFEEKWEKACS